MSLKSFLNFLLVFLVSIPHQKVVARNDAAIELEELIKNPGWSLMKSETIIDDGKEITMLQLLNTFEDNSKISDGPDKPLIRHLAIALSCDQWKFVKKFIILVLSILRVCRQLVDFPVDYISCFKSMLKNIRKLDLMVTKMLNILMYFHQLSPTTTDFKQLYNALMTLKLYSAYVSKTATHSSFINAEGKPDEIKIEIKCQEIERLYFSIDLQIQTFAVMHCLPTTHPLRQNEIEVEYEEYIIQKVLNTESDSKSYTNENYSEAISKIVNTFNKERFLALGFEHLELYNINNMNVDLERIWKLLEQQPPGDHKMRIHWLDEPKNVTTVVQEVKYQCSTKKFAEFQKLSLKSIAQMFYKQLILTVQSKFNEMKTKTVEGLCPPNFFTMLRYNWVELQSEQFPAVIEACLSIRNSISKRDCQETFYNSLKRRWMSFNAIKEPAIAAACFSVAVWSTKPNVPLYTKWISLLVESIYSFLYRPSKAIAMGLASSKKEFWSLIKNELMKFRSVGWPAETAETLETLTFYLENLDNIVNPKDVIKLLELEIKRNSADFADNEETLREIDSVKRLEILRKFTDNVVKLRKTINVSLNNVLLLNATDFEQIKLVRPSEKFDNVAQEKVCKLSTKIIALFTILKIHLIFYIKQDKKISNFVLNLFGLVSDKNHERLLSMANFLFLEMLKAPKPENLNLRNAVVLMFMFHAILIHPTDDKGNDVVWKMNQHIQLALLIINQIKYYVVKNCGNLEYKSMILNKIEFYSFSALQNAHRKIVHDIDNVILEMKNVPLIDDKCEVNLNKASFEKLVDGDFSPLNCIDQLQIQWGGAYKTIQTIREEVLSSMNPNKFAKYQSMVLSTVTSIFLGYILNILQSAGRNEVKFTDSQKKSILFKTNEFVSIVYPSSKNDSPSYIFNVLIWCFEQNKISHIKANILQGKIEKKIETYGINMTDYYSVLKSNNIISDEHASGGVQEIYIAPLEIFVDEWLVMFKQDFYCVENYMKLII